MRDERQTVAQERIAAALERLADQHTQPTLDAGFSMPADKLYGRAMHRASLTELSHAVATITTPHNTDTAYADRMGKLSDALLLWVNAWGAEPPAVADTFRDAIRQATKLETLEWFAALASRYGFNNE